MNNDDLLFIKECFSRSIKKCEFYLDPQPSNFPKYGKVYKMLKETKFVIITHCEVTNGNTMEGYFIIALQTKTIIIFNQALIMQYHPFFSSILDLNICFIKKSKEIFDSLIRIDYHEIKLKLHHPDSIMPNITKSDNNDFWDMIIPSLKIYAYKNNIKKYYPRQNNNNNANNVFNEDEYINLGLIECRSSSYCHLIYHIKKEVFLVNKMFIDNSPKLYNRELKNYLILNHPLIPQFYGISDKKRHQSIFIEYINGISLYKIDINNLQIKEKLKIIYELMHFIEYIHSNQLVIRIMSPSDIIIDDTRNAFFIDFDRLVSYEYCHDENYDKTMIFNSPFLEDTDNYSYESDIYMLGKLIIYIMNGEYSRGIDQKENINFDGLTVLEDIYKKCIKTKPEERPTIKHIISVFYLQYHSLLDIDIFADYFNQRIESILNRENEIEKNQKYIEEQYNLGMIYYEGKYIKQDINKAIHYFTLAANGNDIKSQFNLGMIYYEGKDVEIDINKAIHYFSLAANGNDIKSQFNLGMIYYEGKYIKQDINKAIHYFSLAANGNDIKSQFNLGMIYYEGKYIKQDINKAIHYFTLAANGNDIKSQFNLGMIYYEGKDVEIDINKAIHYFSLAANGNDIKSQFNLGMIYYEGKYIKQDINKAIHYFTLAANGNDIKSQFNLGMIYYEGKDVEIDINKAIHYFSLAANGNDIKSQFNLGMIYYEGKYIKQDINKSIHYFSLAANQGFSEAQFLLGIIYSNFDFQQAVNYYSLASKQNSIHAQYNLGSLYLEHNDIDKSIYYYSLAAKQNYVKAQFNLGNIYLDKKFGHQNINEAINFFSLAANQNDQFAQFNLGLIYYDGNFIQKDINKAIHYFTLSANQNNVEALFILGKIYYEGKYVERNAIVAFNYFINAANQGHKKSQAFLNSIHTKIE